MRACVSALCSPTGERVCATRDILTWRLFECHELCVSSVDDPKSIHTMTNLNKETSGQLVMGTGEVTADV